MISVLRSLAVLRVGVFLLLMAICWGTWFSGRHGVHGGVGVWLPLMLLVLLFGWSFVLYRRERPLAWLSWATVLVIIYLALTQGAR
jgi:hypothetical protein